MATLTSSEIVYSYIDFDGKLVNVIKIIKNGVATIKQKLAPKLASKKTGLFMLRTKGDQYSYRSITFWVYPSDAHRVHIDHGDNTPFTACSEYAREIVEAKMSRMPGQWYWEENDKYKGVPDFMRSV